MVLEMKVFNDAVESGELIGLVLTLAMVMLIIELVAFVLIANAVVCLSTGDMYFDADIVAIVELLIGIGVSAILKT